MDKKEGKTKIIIFVLAIILFIILVCVVIYRSSLEEEQVANLVAHYSEDEEETPTLAKILEKDDVKYVDMNGYKLQVRFSRNLYDADGKSNKDYFYKAIKDTADFLKKTFYFIDEERNIEIQVFYYDKVDHSRDENYKAEVVPRDPEKEIKISINNSNSFFDDTDGKTYVELAEAEIIEETTIYIDNETVSDSRAHKYSPKDYYKTYGQPIGTDEQGFEILDDGSILVKKFEGKNVIQTVIFKGDRLNEFIDFEGKYSLDRVLEEYGEAPLGSKEQGYLGYRNNQVYMFFYEDEIVMYLYEYNPNSKFENYLKEYLVDEDINKLRVVTRGVYFSYYTDEYTAESIDPETGETIVESLLLDYPEIGFKIEVDSQNKTHGITFYNNYYMSDFVRENISNGTFSFVGEDAIDLHERERRFSEVR